MIRSIASRPSSRRERLAAVALLAVAASSCSVSANLSADELLVEVDAIVRIEGTGRDLHLRYAERADVARWYTRAWLTQPLRAPLSWVFGRTGEQQLENPRGHVRELLLELPDEVGGDLLVGAKSAVRLGWIGQLESNSHSRMVAVDGLAAIARDLGLPLFAGDFQRFGAVADAERIAAARAGVASGRPDVRSPALRDAATLRPYTDALARLCELPLDDGIARWGLLEEVAGLLVAEPLAALRPAIEASLRAALVHAIEGLLLEVVQGRSGDDVELRLCALEQIRRQGGPRVVPLLLAIMAASPTQISRGDSRYDPDPLVQLRLIQYCGQLRGELATTAVRLPGRQGFETFSPSEFLAITVLHEDAYYSKLRTPALVALTWSLQRPRLDPDPKWVLEWRNQQQ